MHLKLDENPDLQMIKETENYDVTHVCLDSVVICDLEIVFQQLAKQITDPQSSELILEQIAEIIETDP